MKAIQLGPRQGMALTVAMAARSVAVTLALCTAALLTPLSPARANGHDADVLRPGSYVAGRSIGEWTGAWWQAAIEATDFPFPAAVAQPGALGDVGGPVFFAVASPGPGATLYTYDVPRGKHVLLPLYTYAWLTQAPSDPCSQFACAAALSERFVRSTSSMSVKVDGNPLRNLFRHLETTPRTIYANAPTDGWWAGGDPSYAGVWYGAASGYWLMLEPLSPGRHVVSISVNAPYSSVCADGSDSCDIPKPGEPETATTTLILNVPCNRGNDDDNRRCGQGRHDH